MGEQKEVASDETQSKARGVTVHRHRTEILSDRYLILELKTTEITPS